MARRTVHLHAVRDLPPMPPRRPGLGASFGHAFEGLLQAIVKQRNMKIHLVSAILVGLVGSGIPLGLAEKVTLLVCILLVLFAELLNTALEALVDLHTERFEERARVVKDTAAAGVLVLAAGTVVIFAAVLATSWQVIASSGPAIVRQLEAGLPLAALASALLASFRRPAAIDWLLLVAGAALLALLASFSQSAVFTAVTGVLFALCGAAAHRRRMG